MAFTATATAGLAARQLWGRPSATSPSTTTSCSAVTLASGGILTINPTSILTFATDMIYTPNCYANESSFFTTPQNDEPFYASATVLIYVVATSTVIAWFLFTLLLIAPGGHVPKATPTSNRWLRGRTMSQLMSHGPVIVPFSSRPWLQKVAAFLVTVGLSIASAYIFSVANNENGIISAADLRGAIVGSIHIRILRVVSDVFIWLAQVQTLIRLFPRRKEKLIIKWFGFLLILLDMIFSSLNSFYVNSKELPRWYSDAIPALSYLFQLSISLLYGAWVFYYVATKRRYAFINRDMPNISIISLLSIVSILIPVGFFVADVSVPVVAGWGDFFRWVGAAAASVLVWEWVERIEYLEREEKKDGILGREIFEEDEMLDGEKQSTSRRRSFPSGNSGDAISKPFGKFKNDFIRIVARKGVNRSVSVSTLHTERTESDGVREDQQATIGYAVGPQPVSILMPPPTQSTTPLSRTDTGTPSTVYAVHYHPISNTPPIPGPNIQALDRIPESATTTSSTKVASTDSSNVRPKQSTLTVQEPTFNDQPRNVRRSIYYAQNMFKRGKKSPPIEVKQAMSLHGKTGSQQHRKVMKRGLGRFMGLRDPHDADLTTSEPPTFIPAPPRGHAWSPGDMRHSPVAIGGRREPTTIMPLDSTLMRPPNVTHSTSTTVATISDSFHPIEDLPDATENDAIAQSGLRETGTSDQHIVEEHQHSNPSIDTRPDQPSRPPERNIDR